jgi:NADPH:quinone reductase-like Zn-dependent oxidoreductase
MNRMSTETMGAAVLHTLGGIPGYEQFPAPAACDGEVLVRVTAAALKPVDRLMASGGHYASYGQLPAVCGSDGAGRLEDGSRVFFFNTRRPYGGMAEQTVVPQGRWFAVPDEVDDVTAAAASSPGMAAWKAVLWRGGLQAGQTVLVLGATGNSGRVAVQMAKRAGAAKVVAAGRDPEGLARLRELGADAVIQLDQPVADLAAAFAAESRPAGYDLVADYVWGRPAEALFRSLTQPDLIPDRPVGRTLYVQVGQGAGEMIGLSANALRSVNLEIVGSGSGAIPSGAAVQAAYQQLMAAVASGEILIETERLPLSEVAQGWQRPASGRRLVFVP